MPRREIQDPTLARDVPLLPPWLPWSYALLLILTLSFWSTFLLKQTSLLGYVYRRDFSSVYVGARIVAEGSGSHLYNLEVQRNMMDAVIAPYSRRNLLPYIYPAYVAVLLSPLGRLSLGKAFLVWTGINFLVTAWIAARLIRYDFSSTPQRFALLLAIFMWVPLQLTLSHGQMGLVCTLALTEVLVSLRAGHQWRAGCWLALGLMKPQVLAFPLLALLLWRCWRTLAAFLATSVIILGVSFARLGFWIADYSRLIADFNRRGGDVSLYPVAMQNWRGLVAALAGNDTGFTARLLWTALTLGSLGLVVLVCYRRRSHLSDTSFRSSLPPHWEARFAIAILTGILTSPYLYGHDWVIALPALTALFSLGKDLCSKAENSHVRPPLTLLWLIALAPIVCFAVQFGIWPTSSPVQLIPWYMGLLAVMAALSLRRASHSQEVLARSELAT